MPTTEGAYVSPADWRQWIPDPSPDAPVVSEIPEIAVPGLTGPGSPQPLVAPVEALPLVPVDPGTALWVVGAHGGAGESTLAGLAEGWAGAGHGWPQPPQGRAAVLLCARTHVSGLLAAQAALRQWAGSGAGTVHLLGLVLLADAPGRLPKPLRDLAEVVAGGAPRVWTVPWVQAWRYAEADTPRPVSRLVGEVTALLPHITEGEA